MYDGNDIANNDEEYMCGDTQALYYLDQPTYWIIWVWYQLPLSLLSTEWDLQTLTTPGKRRFRFSRSSAFFTARDDSCLSTCIILIRSKFIKVKSNANWHQCTFKNVHTTNTKQIFKKEVENKSQFGQLKLSQS